MRVWIDNERCRGHAVCCALCPAVFEITEDGWAQPQAPDVPAQFEDAVATAVLSCPEGAITTS